MRSHGARVLGGIVCRVLRASAPQGKPWMPLALLGPYCLSAGILHANYLSDEGRILCVILLVNPQHKRKLWLTSNERAFNTECKS